MMNASIRELTTEDEIHSAYTVMNELRTHLSREEFVDLVTRMRPKGYRLFAAFDGDRIVALAGVGFGLNLYFGSYLWVYDLVTTSAARSRGHGAALLGYLEEMACSEGCDTIALSSGLKRVDAHRFYEDKMGYTKGGYGFQKPLKGQPFSPAPDPAAAS